MEGPFFTHVNRPYRIFSYVQRMVCVLVFMSLRLAGTRSCHKGIFEKLCILDPIYNRILI